MTKSTELAHTLVKSLGNGLGESLVLDDRHCCQFVHPQGFRVEIEFNEELEHLFAIASLGRMPDEQSERFWRFLLRCNYLGHGTRQATIGISEDGEIVVHMGRPVRWLSEGEFAEMIEMVAGAVLFLEKSLEEDQWKELMGLAEEEIASEFPNQDASGEDSRMAWMTQRA